MPEVAETMYAGLTDREVYSPASASSSGATRDIERSSIAAWVQPTMDVLIQILGLPHGWDSYGAKPVSRAAGAIAFNTLVQLAPHDIPAPSVVPTKRGTIQFEWHLRGIDLEIEVHPSGKVSASFEDSISQVEWEHTFQSNFAELSRAFSVMTSRSK